MIDIRMKNHLVSDSDCNTIDLWPAQQIYKEWQIMLELTCSGGDTILQFTRSIEQDNWKWWHEISYLV